MNKAYHRASILQKQENRRLKQKNINSSYQQFSSYQSLHQSEHDHSQFSDYQSSLDKQKHQGKHHLTQKQVVSQIVIEQRPLKCQNNQKSKVNIQNNNKEHGYKSHKKQGLPREQRIKSNESSFQHVEVDQNLPLKYNYMKKVEKQLSTIHEDYTEQLKASTFNPKYPKHNQPYQLYPKYAYPILPPSRAVDDLYHLQRSYTHKIQTQSLRINLQSQKVHIICLQQQNYHLKQRIINLQLELKTKVLEKSKSQTQKYVQTITINKQKQEKVRQREQAKKKLLSQIYNLQAKCEQMRQQMKAYKQKQSVLFQKLMREKQEEKAEFTRLRNRSEYEGRFVDIFLNMVSKLPIKVEKGWSAKKKIAVGWKVVKYLIKKGLKLGINVPVIQGLSRQK